MQPEIYRDYKIWVDTEGDESSYYFEGPPGAFCGSNTGFLSPNLAMDAATAAIDQNIAEGK